MGQDSTLEMETLHADGKKEWEPASGRRFGRMLQSVD